MLPIQITERGLQSFLRGTVNHSCIIVHIAGRLRQWRLRGLGIRRAPSHQEQNECHGKNKKDPSSLHLLCADLRSYYVLGSGQSQKDGVIGAKGKEASGPRVTRI